jgi:type III restriction enzyme
VDVRPQTLVQALRERMALELRFPRVVGYISDARFRITADVDAMPRLEISPEVDPTWVKVGARGAGRGAVHDRGEFYEAHRLQRTMFEIAAKIADDLKFGDEQGRRIMFPQVLRIVRRYVETKVVSVGGATLDEAALGAYRREIESRLSAAIRPAAGEGEQPLLPVLHDMAGIGTTDISPFLTVRQCQPTVRSHLSQAVCDSGWEAQVARALDESPRVRAWVKNHRLGFEIPYSFRGERHAYTPDFLVALTGAASGGHGAGHAAGVGEIDAAEGEHLLIEVKGLEREQDRAKEVGVQRWVAAVNHWGRLGRWRFAKIHSPHDLARVIGGPVA